MLRFVSQLASVLLCALSLSACAGDGAAFNPTDPRLQMSHLEYVSMAAQSLRPSQTADLTVKYVYDDGTAIANAPISFAVVGVAGDASLTALSAVSDGAGLATVQLRAGNMEGHFRVGVTPPKGDSIFFDVDIANHDAGGIVAMMSYTGMQRFDRFRPFLFRGLRCDALGADHLPTAERAGSAVTRLEDQPSFAGLVAASDWTVAIVADITEAPHAFGCAEGITVRNGQVTNVPITLTDLTPPALFNGTYDLDNTFDFAGVLPPTAATAVRIIDELSDDTDIRGNASTMDYGQDPGAFFVDFAMRATCHWDCTAGQNYDSCTQMNHGYGDLQSLYGHDFTSFSGAQSRFFGGCGAWESANGPAERLINEQVERLIPGSVTKLAVIAGDVARALDHAHIKSELILTAAAPDTNNVPMTHHLMTLDVPLHRLDGTVMNFTINLDDLGFSSIRTTAMATAEGDTLHIPMHSFTLDWGRLVQYIYLHGLLPLLGYTSTADLLAHWISCDTIAHTLATDVGILTEMQWHDACGTAITTIGHLLENEIAALISGHGTLTLMGTATGGNFAADRTAQQLSAGMWMGAWGEPSMTAGMSEAHAVHGTFTGMLRPVMH